MSMLSSDGWEAPRRQACFQLLKRVRARIERPSAHSAFEWARDAGGRSVHPRAATAVCWCVNGAIQAEALGTESVGRIESHIDAFVALQEQIDPGDPPKLTLSEVNDGANGHKRILATIDIALIKLRGN